MEQEKLVQLVRELREQTGDSLMNCKEAVLIFNGNLKQAKEYLRTRGHAVCRKRPDGTRWQQIDYIEEAIRIVREEEGAANE